MSSAIEATTLVAADLQSSLSIYIASEALTAASGILSTAELTMISLLTAALATSLGSYLKRLAENFPVRDSALRLFVQMLGELFLTLSFLSATMVVQLSIVLIRGSLTLPYSRLLSVLCTLLLVKVVLSASSVASHELLRPTGRVDEGKDR